MEMFIIIDLIIFNYLFSIKLCKLQIFAAMKNVLYVTKFISIFLNNCIKYLKLEIKVKD